MTADGSSEDKRAVALRYGEGDDTPRVVAKGYGDIADAIIQRAEDNDLYVHQSSDLVRLLSRVDLDDRIPPELYLAVAELLAWVFELEQNVASDNPPPDV